MAPLRALWELARDRDDCGLITWEELERLANELSQGRLVHKPTQTMAVVACVNCGAGVGIAAELGASGVKPAEGSSAATAGVAPVPMTAGDRRNIDGVDIAWLQIEKVQLLVTAGKLEEVSSQVGFIGGYADPSEAADAIVGFREAGMGEVADSILGHAAGRPDRGVLEVLLALIERERRGDADVLLIRALAT